MPDANKTLQALLKSSRKYNGEYQVYGLQIMANDKIQIENVETGLTELIELSDEEQSNLDAERAAWLLAKNKLKRKRKRKKQQPRLSWLLSA
jgi:hypothetical protein